MDRLRRSCTIFRYSKRFQPIGKIFFLLLKFWITLQITTRRTYQSKSKACKTPAAILHVHAHPTGWYPWASRVDPIGIFRKQDYSSKKIDTRGRGRRRDTRHTLDKRTMVRASHISNPSTISPTMKRNLFFHVQLQYWPPCLQNALCTRGKYGAKV